jgi:hypothetical protein
VRVCLRWCQRVTDAGALHQATLCWTAFNGFAECFEALLTSYALSDGTDGSSSSGSKSSSAVQEAWWFGKQAVGVRHVDVAKRRRVESAFHEQRVASSMSQAHCSMAHNEVKRLLTARSVPCEDFEFDAPEQFQRCKLELMSSTLKVALHVASSSGGGSGSGAVHSALCSQTLPTVSQLLHWYEMRWLLLASASE